MVTVSPNQIIIIIIILLLIPKIPKGLFRPPRFFKFPLTILRQLETHMIMTPWLVISGTFQIFHFIFISAPKQPDICTCHPGEVIRSCYSVFRLRRGGQELDGFESPETQPFENRDHLAGICWTASALPDDSSVHRRSMDYAIIASPQLGRDHRRGSNHGRTRGQVGGHLFLPPQTATNGAPNTGRRCCSFPRSRPTP